MKLDNDTLLNTALSSTPNNSIKKQLILSGIRPTGTIHLGNYLGAIKNWVSLQNEANQNFFCIVDQHALTTASDAANLSEHSYLAAATYLACGIDPLKSKIFIQSHVSAHTELAWYLSCITPLGWLNRMTQFKDKSGKDQQPLSGLLFYPVLMAADILAYRATIVPVGQDQKQHVELARDIAIAFNNYVNGQVLTVPEPLILAQTAKIMNLRDGTKKMSKSDESDYSRINLTDSNDLIALKIKKCKTDANLISSNIDDLNDRPEAYNLLNMIAIFKGNSIKQVCADYSGKGFGILKTDLTALLISEIDPIRTTINQLMTDKVYLNSVLADGRVAAIKHTSSTMNDVRQALNMVPM